MKRICLSLAALGAAVALAGCNETVGGAMAGPVASAPGVAASLRLPPGAPCTREIDHYETIVKADLDTGNVEQKVYDQIQKDVSRAAAACSAGKGGEAQTILSSSKTRHGYRA